MLQKENVMEFRRKQYLDSLVRKKHNGLIKVVTGIRRCGKSYLLFTLFRNYLSESGVPESHIIEMAFDSYENTKCRDPEVFYPYIKGLIQDNERYYILLDEVQLLNEFESVLNGLMRIPNVDIYVTGSNAKFLSKDVITEFRGRGDEVHVNPLSFAEFMECYDGNKYDGWNEYVLYGGLPPVVLLSSPQEKIAFLENLFTETYNKDVMKRNRLKNEAELNDILNLLASSIGSLTNPSKLSDRFKSIKKVSIGQKTIKKYIDCLCEAYIVDKAVRYDVKGKDYLSTPLKYYYTDLGLRNARINFRQTEFTHLMENMIFNELKARGFQVDVGLVEIVERKDDKLIHKQLEIDFVCNTGSKRYYIQSAYAMSDEEKEEQEKRPLKNTGDEFKKIIIVKDAPAPWYTEDGVLVMSIYDFLLDEKSLER